MRIDARRLDLEDGVNLPLTFANQHFRKIEGGGLCTMRRTTGQSVEDLFKSLGATPMTRRVRADSVFRRLRETEEDEVLGSFIRAPKKAPRAADPKKAKKS